jgi:hypothetical protein
MRLVKPKSIRSTIQSLRRSGPASRRAQRRTYVIQHTLSRAGIRRRTGSVGLRGRSLLPPRRSLLPCRNIHGRPLQAYRELPLVSDSTARENRGVGLTAKVDESQAPVPRFDASDGGVIGPKAYDILERERCRNGDVDRDEVREDDTVSRQAVERIQKSLPPREIVR